MKNLLLLLAHFLTTNNVPKHLGSDNDPLFLYQQWQANLRTPGVDEVKTAPYTPVSHPFIERLTGTVRREFLDHTPFWNAADLARKLADFQGHYNQHRTHSSLAAIRRLISTEAIQDSKQQ